MNLSNYHSYKSMEIRITSDDTGDESLAFSKSQFEPSNHRTSSDTLESSLNDIHDDSISLSLNDDLASAYGGRSDSVAFSRRSFESSSIFTTSFRPSFDDSLPSLGLNKLSTQKVSPLGPNSIYELVADVDAKKSKASSLSPHVNRSSHSRNKINIYPPSQTDIPSIQLTKVERASKDELKQFLSDVSKEYEIYNSNKKLTASTLESFAKLQDKQNGTLFPIAQTDNLDEIPEIFFSENFNLDDPRVFNSVTEDNDLDGLNDDLQDQLSVYLDTVEVHLVNEISQSSASFFNALNDLNEINGKNTATVDKINDLKGQLASLNTKTKHRFEIIDLLTKRNNASKLEQALLQALTIQKQTETTHYLFLQGEYEKCLDKLDYVGAILNGKDSSLGWPFDLQDLTNVPALQQTKEELLSLRVKTGQSYSKLLADFLLGDLRSHYEDIDFAASLKRLESGASYQKQITDDFKSQLETYINGLSRCNELVSSFKAYGDQVIAEIKNIVRIFLPNEETTSTTSTKDSSSVASSSINRPSGKSLSTMIKAMTPRDFEDMLIKIYTTVSEGLRRLTIHQKLLLDLALSSGSLEQDKSSMVLKLDIRNVINKSIEITQIRMGKVISVRTDLNSNLRHDYFLRFYYINMLFLSECESISALNFKTFPDVISTQTRNFNASFHNSNLKRISLSVDKEDWKPLIVSPNLQKVVDNIVDNINLDADKLWRDSLLAPKHIQNSSELDSTQNSHKRSIVVGDKTFVASNSLLVVISIIRDIFVLKSNFNSFRSQYESNVIELLKYFNNRTMQSLKKADGSLDRDMNLSVVGESLDCIQELIHYIRIGFDNLEHDEAYNNLLSAIAASKYRIDEHSLPQI